MIQITPREPLQPHQDPWAGGRPRNCKIAGLVANLAAPTGPALRAALQRAISEAAWRAVASGGDGRRLVGWELACLLAGSAFLQPRRFGPCSLLVDASQACVTDPLPCACCLVTRIFAGKLCSVSSSLSVDSGRLGQAALPTTWESIEAEGHVRLEFRGVAHAALCTVAPQKNCRRLFLKLRVTLRG